MMRGTVYTVFGDNERIEWSVHTLNVETAMLFIIEARRLWPSPGARLEFGPIGPPWSQSR